MTFLKAFHKRRSTHYKWFTLQYDTIAMRDRVEGEERNDGVWVALY